MSAQGALPDPNGYLQLNQSFLKHVKQAHRASLTVFWHQMYSLSFTSNNTLLFQASPNTFMR